MKSKLILNKKVLVIFVSIVLISTNCIKLIKLHNLLIEQQSEIDALKKEIILLKESTSMTEITWSEDGYNYLAIGNSITIHGYADYWFDDDRGMASSKDSKDYVHIVKSNLEEKHNIVTMHAINFSAWETNFNDRAEFLEVLRPYLSTEIDLITIQLGENASNLNTWESDFEELLSYILKSSPQAQIIVVGDFWENGERDSLKETASNKLNVTYVSLEGIKDNSEYYAGMGTAVEAQNGETHYINHDGVANHPGDRGMKAIAERIISSIH